MRSSNLSKLAYEILLISIVQIRGLVVTDQAQNFHSTAHILCLTFTFGPSLAISS